MTKTITQLQPMIYGDLFARTCERKRKQRKLTRIIHRAIWPAYVVVGLMIVFDAGAAPWDVRFWLIFLPFFLLGEAALAALKRTDRKIVAPGFESSNATHWFPQFESTASSLKPPATKAVDPVIIRLKAATIASESAETAELVPAE